jgi:uncharacterized membrane protein
MHISPLLILHISGGITGILSGTVTMFFRKGSREHALAGRVFVVAMLCMAGAGTYMALMKSQAGNVMGGVMTLYMVGTAWKAGRRKNGETSILDWAALLVALAFGAVAVIFGFQAVLSPDGLKAGYPPPVYFIWGAVALLSAAGDTRMLVRRGVFFGQQRVVRHLWRMSLGFFIATGSFFLGQQKVFPAALRGLTVWWVAAFLPLLLMIFWLIRVRFKNAYIGSAGDASGLRAQSSTIAGARYPSSPSAVSKSLPSIQPISPRW